MLVRCSKGRDFVTFREDEESPGANNPDMEYLRLIACVGVCLVLSACGNADNPPPAPVPGIEPPAEWGAPMQDYIENREGGENASVASVLEAQVQRYRNLTPTAVVEETTGSTATIVLDLSDMRRGKEALAGVAPDPALLAAPADYIRILIEVRTNGPVFVVRTREFDITEPAPARGG